MRPAKRLVVLVGALAVLMEHFPQRGFSLGVLVAVIFADGSGMNPTWERLRCCGTYMA